MSDDIRSVDDPLPGQREKEAPGDDRADAGPVRTAETSRAAFDAERLLDVPRHVREAARSRPDHWFSLTDPVWAGPGEPPDWAVIGEWHSGPTGEIEEWSENPAYRPSPRALGWPEPTDEVDEAVQLASTGYGRDEEVARRLAVADVAVLVGPDSRPVMACTPEGLPVVPVFTSTTHLRVAGPLASETVAIIDLVADLPVNSRLCVNPTAAVSMVIGTLVLLDVVEQAEEPTAGTEVHGAAADPETSGAPAMAEVPEEDWHYRSAWETGPAEVLTDTETGAGAEAQAEAEPLPAPVPGPVDEAAPAPAPGPVTGERPGHHEEPEQAEVAEQADGLRDEPEHTPAAREFTITDPVPVPAVNENSGAPPVPEPLGTHGRMPATVSQADLIFQAVAGVPGEAEDSSHTADGTDDTSH